MGPTEAKYDNTSLCEELYSKATENISMQIHKQDNLQEFRSRIKSS
jgi:hypothetical protein